MGHGSAPALRPLHGGRDMSRAVDEAAAWLRVVLERGPMPAATVRVHAAARGIASRTLQRASAVAGVIIERRGFSAGSVWRLPSAPEPETRKTDARVLELRKPCRRRVLSGGCGRWAGPRRARALLAAARAVRWRRVPGIRASGGALRFVAAHSGRLYLCCGRRCPHPHPRQLEPGIADRVCVGPPTPTQPGHRAGFFVAVRQRGPSVWWGPAGVPGVG